MNCERVRARRAGYHAGSLTPADEKRIDRHLVGCEACWERFREEDPARLFSSLPSPRRDERFWSGFWPGIRAGIEPTGVPAPAAGGRPAWWPVPAVRPAWAVAASLVVVLAAGAWYLGSGGGPGGVPEGAVGIAGRTTPGARVRPAAPPPTIDSLPSANSRVHHFLLGDPGRQPTEVILIFDESIDI